MDLDALQLEVFRLHAAGEQQRALRLLDEVGVIEGAEARQAFWRACLRSVTGDAEAALAALEEALRAGHCWHPDMLDDSDLDGIRADPRFTQIVDSSSDRFHALAAAGPPPPLVLDPGRDAAPTLVALHRAASSPRRAAATWSSAAEAGWRVVLPHAPFPMTSQEWLWLDLRRGVLGLAEAEGALAATDIGDDRIVVAGFAQGAAVALHLALSGTVPANGVLMVAATDRYLEVLDVLDGEPPRALSVQMVVGSEERHLDAARQAADRLVDRGVDVDLEVRDGVGHVVPPGFVQEVPSRLARYR